MVLGSETQVSGVTQVEDIRVKERPAESIKPQTTNLTKKSFTETPPWIQVKLNKRNRVPTSSKNTSTRLLKNISFYCSWKSSHKVPLYICCPPAEYTVFNGSQQCREESAEQCEETWNLSFSLYEKSHIHTWFKPPRWRGISVTFTQRASIHANMQLTITSHLQLHEPTQKWKLQCSRVQLHRFLCLKSLWSTECK